MPLSKRDEKMSLTTLTFSNSARTNGTSSARILVLKTDQFFGTEECCIIGKLVDGIVSEEMQISGTEKKIVSLESHYGDRSCSKKGGQVVLMVSGARKEDYDYGQEITFEKTIAEAVPVKPRGRLIIA